MKFDTFQKLEETALDFKTALLAVHAARREAEALLVAIDERLKAERDQCNARREHLLSVLNDAARSETIKRVSRGELAALQETRLEPSITEGEAVVDLMSELRQSVRDTATLKGQLETAFNACQQALTELRGETLAKYDPQLMDNWIRALEKDYRGLVDKWGREALNGP